jgi:tRNA C32,U32 (ribose-2'-O)-methylase TrmJ
MTNTRFDTRQSMTNARFDAARRADPPPNDLELVVHALEEALIVIDDFDPDRNPARCMRQLRRLFDNPRVRVAVRRLAAAMPPVPRPEGRL